LLAGERRTVVGFWQALGRGVIKLVICLMAGFGVGFYFVGKATDENPDSWQRRGPPPGLFEGVAFGLLTAAGLLFLLFVLPWLFRRAPSAPVSRFRDSADPRQKDI
jgi:hypothetical protein